MQSVIFQPMAAVMLLTMLVWCYMYLLRNRYVISNKMNPQKLSKPERVNELLPEGINNPSNNLKNLFELPIIFYGVCITAYVLNSVDNTLLWLAWAFAISRVAHSLIQCTYNKVMHRFFVYFVSSLFLWAMVIKLSLFIFSGG